MNNEKKNKIDENVDKVISEVGGSVWVRRLFKLVLASAVGGISGAITCGATHDIGDSTCLLAGWAVGLALFFFILMKK